MKLFRETKTIRRGRDRKKEEWGVREIYNIQYISLRKLNITSKQNHGTTKMGNGSGLMNSCLLEAQALEHLVPSCLCLGRFRRCNLVGWSMSLWVGFEDLRLCPAPGLLSLLHS